MGIKGQYFIVYLPYENISYIENCIDWDKEVQ